MADYIPPVGKLSLITNVHTRAQFQGYILGAHKNDYWLYIEDSDKHISINKESVIFAPIPDADIDVLNEILQVYFKEWLQSSHRPQTKVRMLAKDIMAGNIKGLTWTRN